jgi:hypothetical protein
MDGTDEVVLELSRELVGSIAPQELPMFRANSRAYLADPQRALAPAQGQDEMLGFGVGEIAAFITPVVLEAVRAVVRFLVEEGGKALRSESQSVIGSWIKSLFKVVPRPSEAQVVTAAKAVPEATSAPAALSLEQLRRLRAVAFDKARQYVDEVRAAQLADELVGRIATT